MFVHVGKTYYALEAKTMATDDFLPGPPSWDCDCYSGGPPEPPPLFHLPPPPKPPGINGPLEHSLADDCNGPWTCPALALEAGTSFGSSQDGSLPRASPEVSMPAIIISASVLGLFFFIAAVIFVSRMWRSYKNASKKASCDLDAADLYEDLPVAPPLLPGPLHMAHNNCPQALRIKNDGFGHHMGALPQLPDNQTHVYSPEPRTETPSDHLYHHISSGSETFSFSTGEAPSNALLPQNLHLIHNEEDEVCCSSSAHSYNSSATGTPTSSPTPAHSQMNPSGRFVRGVNLNGPPIVSMLPGFPSGHCSGTRHKHVNGGGHHVASLLPSSVYSINPCLDNQQHNPAANKHSDNMVPLAQIYSPGSHLYEAATLIRPSGDHTASNCSMVHWGNVPAPYVDAPYLAKPTKHSNNKRDNKNVPFVHNTMAHPLEYGAKNVAVHHGCPMRQYSPQHGPGVIQFHPLMVHAHQTHVHEFPQQYYLQHSNHLPLPLNSSTIMPNAKLAKSMYDMARSKDITPTNSDPIDSLYNTSPHSDLDLIATTCFSTQASLPNQNEYQTALDAYNLNVLPGQRHRLPEDSLHGMGVSDSSGSSHPSSSNDGAAVTESSSLNSSGTSSSTLPLSTPLNNTMRRDLPPLPSRADRYRIYAQNNEAGFANRSNTCRRSANNNSGDSTASDSSRNFKSCDDLKNVSTVDNSRVSLRQNGNECGRRGMDDPNVANNNLVSDGAVQIDASDNCSLDEMEPEIVRSSRAGFLKSSNNSRKSTPKKKRRGHVDEVSEEYEEDVLYDHCGDT